MHLKRIMCFCEQLDSSNKFLLLELRNTVMAVRQKKRKWSNCYLICFIKLFYCPRELTIDNYNWSRTSCAEKRNHKTPKLKSMECVLYWSPLLTIVLSVFCCLCPWKWATGTTFRLTLHFGPIVSELWATVYVFLLVHPLLNVFTSVNLTRAIYFACMWYKADTFVWFPEMHTVW